MKSAALRDSRFLNCKLLGVRFDECNEFLFSAHFENCMLKFASFHKLKLKQTHFQTCNLQEADFSETDLTGSIFETCDLQRTLFDHTNLGKVDFRSSFNYSIDPEKNRIKTIAAPMNSKRHPNFNLPCQKIGICYDCRSPQRICNTWSINEKSYPKHRIKIILIDEDLGY